MARTLRAALVLGSILSLAVSIAVANIWFVVGSVEGHWYYQYVQPFDVRAITIVLQSLAAIVAVLAVSDRFADREWWLVAAWVAAGSFVQWRLRTLAPASFGEIFASNGANSFYGVTQQYGAALVLADFERLRHFMPLHAQSNMPGKLLVVYGLELISTRPAVLAWLVVALSNLAGVVLYAFVRDLFEDRQVALYSLILYLFVPGKIYFFPLLNTFTPLAIFVCLWLMLRWVSTGRVLYAVLIGAAVYGLILYEPLTLTIGLLMAGIAARALGRGDASWRALGRQVGAGVLAFAVVYVAMVVLFHFNLFSTLEVIGGGASGFNVRHDRPYGIWVGQNLLDFGFGAGVCQVVLFLAALAVALRGPGPWLNRLTRPLALVTVSLAAIVVITDVIGVNRGEAIRLWIFLACLFQIPAAYACARAGSRVALLAVVGTTLLQDAVATMMIGFILP